MKLEQIPGDYDNVDQRALELLEASDYKLAEYMENYKTAPWDMEDDGYKTRNYLERAKANQ